MKIGINGRFLTNSVKTGVEEAAISLLEQAAVRSPDISIRNDLAAALVSHGDVERAAKLLQEILKEAPGYTQARITLSTLELRASRAQQAEALLKDAPEPPDPQLQAELAYAQACVAYAVGRSEDAVALLNAALDKDPWHAAAASSLADLRARREGDDVPNPTSIALEGVSADG